MRILVTGGAGYIGSHAVKELSAAGHAVTVLDNLSRGHQRAVLTDDFIEMGLEDRSGLDTLFSRKRFDAVMHFAAFAYVAESIQHPHLYYRNNVAQTINLLDAMVTHEVKKIVFSSTCATYGETPFGSLVAEDVAQNPINTYARTKLIDEQIIMDLSRTAGMKYCIFRYFNAAGCDPDGIVGEDHRPEPHLIPTILNAARTGATITILGNDYPTPDGTCIRDYTHVKDIARAHLLGMEYCSRENAVFNLGTGRGHSNLEVIGICQKVTGKKIKYTFAGRRPGDAACLVADPARARRVLNWTPDFPDLEGIVATAWRWMLKNPNGYDG
jgi:UDP-glucose 4-epimerase